MLSLCKRAFSGKSIFLSPSLLCPPRSEMADRLNAIADRLEKAVSRLEAVGKGGGGGGAEVNGTCACV